MRIAVFNGLCPARRLPSLPRGFAPARRHPQSLWALPRRCHTQSQWGSSHPSRWLPQATDSERHNLTIVPFQIGFLCPQKTKNHPSTAQRLLYRGVAHLVCTSIIGGAHPFWRALFTLLYICLKWFIQMAPNYPTNVRNVSYICHTFLRQTGDNLLPFVCHL